MYHIITTILRKSFGQVSSEEKTSDLLMVSSNCFLVSWDCCDLCNNSSIFFWAFASSSLVILFSCLSAFNQESFSAVRSSSLCAKRKKNPQAVGRSEMVVTNEI